MCSTDGDSPDTSGAFAQMGGSVLPKLHASGEKEPCLFPFVAAEREAGSLFK